MNLKIHLINIYKLKIFLLILLVVFVKNVLDGVNQNLQKKIELFIIVLNLKLILIMLKYLWQHHKINKYILFLQINQILVCLLWNQLMKLIYRKFNQFYHQ